MVIRYVHECKIVERFWGFFQPKTVNAEGIAGVILTDLATILKHVMAK